MGAGVKVKVFSSKNYNFKGSLKKIKDFKKVCVFVSESHACKSYKGQKRVLDPMEWD